jgi:hypothetical protein
MQYEVELDRKSICFVDINRAGITSDKAVWFLICTSLITTGAISGVPGTWGGPLLPKLLKLTRFTV